MFSYAQILATNHVDHDILSTFVFFGKNNSFEECERTVYPTLRWFPEGTKSGNQLSTAFGTYFSTHDLLLVCSNLIVCSFKNYLNNRKNLKFFDPTDKFVNFRHIPHYHSSVKMSK